MDVILSAVASDLIGRLFSFLIGKYLGSGATNPALRLHRALVRARVVVEEAEGRQITNRAMLQQLNQPRRELCRAAYALDAFRCAERRSHTTVGRSRSHTRPPTATASSDCPDVLLSMVESLEAALNDMREFLVLLGSCPQVTRQPYNAYLFMESCMFGRQVEKEEIISFLLRPARDLDVLPIIGPPGVGKRTLVEHVTLDERVKQCFTKIHHLCSDELDLQSFEHRWSLFDFTSRSLIVVDIVESDDADAKLETWRRFYLAVLPHAHTGSKIIVISRMEDHSNLGTVPAVRLHRPHREELWYFFRGLAFGAADPNDRPDLARLAMALCTKISSHFKIFTTAKMIAASLRADLSVPSWRRVLKLFFESTTLQLGAASVGLNEDKAARHYTLMRPAKDAPDAPCLFNNLRKLTSVAQSDLPKVTLLGLLTGGQSLPSAGKTQFDVLVWQSRIPPYASYIVTCDTDRAHHQQVVALKTRLLNKRRRDLKDDPK